MGARRPSSRRINHRREGDPTERAAAARRDEHRLSGCLDPDGTDQAAPPHVRMCPCGGCGVLLCDKAACRAALYAFPVHRFSGTCEHFDELRTNKAPDWLQAA